MKNKLKDINNYLIMKSIYRVSKALLAIVLLVGLNACDDLDSDAIVLSKNVKLLSAELSDNSVSLRWTKPHISNLEGYYIMRSDEIPEPLEMISECYVFNGVTECYEGYDFSDRIAIINDIDNLSYIDESIPLTSELYYWVIAVGDSLIQSNVKTISFPDITIVPYSAANITYQASSNSLIFTHEIDYQNTKLYKYSLDTKEVTESVSLEDSYYGDLRYFNTGETEVVVLQNYSEIEVYNANTLALIGVKDLSYSIEDITCDNAGHIFVSTYYNVYSYSAKNLQEISSYSTSISGSLFYYNGSLLSVESSYYADYQYFSVASSGALTTESSGYSGPRFYSGEINSANGKIVESDGQVFDFNLNELGDLSVNDYSFPSDYSVCDPKNDQLISLDYHDKTMKSYSLSSYNLLSTEYTLGYPRKAFIKGDGTLLVISNSSNYYNNDKIVIEEF